MKFSVVDVRGDHTNSKVRRPIDCLYVSNLGSRFFFCSALNKKVLFKVLTVKRSNWYCLVFQKPPTQVIDKEYKVLNHAFGYSKFAKHTVSLK